MEKHTKQLLGCLGLAAVAIMTGVAIALPGPEAAAVDSASVNYQVTVRPPASGEIISPSDGAAFTSLPITASVSYSNASYLSYTLKHDGTVIKTDTINLADESGTYNLSFADLTDFGEYTLAVQLNNISLEDTVAFRYSATNPTSNGTDEDGNPVISAETNPQTSTIKVQIYDEDGNPRLNPVYVITVDPSQNPQNITLPFDDFGLDTGHYRVELSSYDSSNNLLDVVSMEIDYTAPGVPPVPDTGGEVPGVPDTGALRIGDLTISRLDYLLTGIVVFALVAGGACYLLHKKKNSRK